MLRIAMGVVFVAVALAATSNVAWASGPETSVTGGAVVEVLAPTRTDGGFIKVSTPAGKVIVKDIKTKV